MRMNQQVEQIESLAPPSIPDAGLGDTAKKRWYVLQAFAGHEGRVKSLLEDYIRRDAMQAFFGEILVPTEKVIEMKSGQKRVTERKFFPGYVLIHMQMTEETWHLVRSVPRTTGFIGSSEHDLPTPISDRDAEDIRQHMRESDDKPKSKFTFAPGEVVRIIDGPFSEFNGTVEDVNFEKEKLRVSVTILGRSTPVELDFMHVTKG